MKKLRRTRHPSKEVNPLDDTPVTREATDEPTLRIHNIKPMKQITSPSTLLSFKWTTSTKSATSEVFTRIEDWSKARFDPKGVQGMQKDRVRVEATDSSATLRPMSNRDLLSSNSFRGPEPNDIGARKVDQGQGSPYDRMVHDQNDLCRDGRNRNESRSVGSTQNETGSEGKGKAKSGKATGLTLSEDIEIYHEESRWSGSGEFPIFSGWNAFCGMHTRPRTVPPTYWDDLIAERNVHRLKAITESLLGEERVDLESQKGSEVEQEQNIVHEDPPKSQHPENSIDRRSNVRSWTFKRFSLSLFPSPIRRDTSFSSSSDAGGNGGNMTSGSSRAPSPSNEYPNMESRVDGSNDSSGFVRSKRLRVVERQDRYPFSR